MGTVKSKQSASGLRTTWVALLAALMMAITFTAASPAVAEAATGTAKVENWFENQAVFTVDGNVAYCYNKDNITNATTAGTTFDALGSSQATYEALQGYSMDGNKTGGPYPANVYDNVRKALYVGYPNDRGGIGSWIERTYAHLDDRATMFRIATQLAVWHYTDGYDINDFIGLEGERAAAIRAIAFKIVENKTSVPSDVTFEIYGKNVGQKGMYQSLVSASVVTTSTTDPTPTPVTPTGNVTIRKIDGDTGQALSGATLHIENAAGETVVAPWTTNGTDKIVSLPAGRYYVVEDAAPNKYIKVDEKQPFVLNVTEGTTTVVNPTGDANGNAKNLPLHGHGADNTSHTLTYVGANVNVGMYNYDGVFAYCIDKSVNMSTLDNQKAFFKPFTNQQIYGTADGQLSHYLPPKANYTTEQILRILYAGASGDAYGWSSLAKDQLDFRRATQQAIWKYTNNVEPEFVSTDNDNYKELVRRLIDVANNGQVSIPEGTQARLGLNGKSLQPVVIASFPAHTITTPGTVSNATVVFKNYLDTPLPEPEPGKVIVNKIDGKGRLLKGASLVIKKKGTNQVVWRSTNTFSGTETIDGLTAGTYVLEEENPPAGYLFADPVEFTVKAGETSTVATPLPRGSVTAREIAVEIPGIGGYEIHDVNGVVAYCIDSEAPMPSSVTYQSSNPLYSDVFYEIAKEAGTSSSALLNNLTKVLYVGYPNDGAGLAAKNGWSDELFRAITQEVIFGYTNGKSDHFPSNLNSIYNDIKSAAAAATVPAGADVLVYSDGMLTGNQPVIAGSFPKTSSSASDPVSVTMEDKMITKVHVTVNKEWEDTATIPEIKVRLLADGIPCTSAVTLNASKLNHTWEYLDSTDKYGNKINYTVEETLPEGYKQVSNNVVANSDGSYTVNLVNTQTSVKPIELTFQAKKALVGVNGATAPALKPNQFRFDLTTTATDGVEITQGARWTSATGELNNPLAAQISKPGTYTFTIAENKDYRAAGSTDADYAGISFTNDTKTITVTVARQNGKLVITNCTGGTLVGKLITAEGTLDNKYESVKTTVRKVWKNADGTEMTSAPQAVDLLVEYVKDGTVLDSQTITVSDMQRHETKEFAKVEGATFRVTEPSVPAGYDVVEPTAANGNGVWVVENKKQADPTITNTTVTLAGNKTATSTAPAAYEAEATENIDLTLTDQVGFSGLAEGVTYTVSSQLYKDGEAQGEPVTKTITSTDASPVTVSFPNVKATGTYCIETKLLQGNKVVFTHNGDLADNAETAVVTKKDPKELYVYLQLNKTIEGAADGAMKDRMFEFKLTGAAQEGASIKDGSRYTNEKGTLRRPFMVQITKPGTYTFQVAENKNYQDSSIDYTGIAFTDEVKTVTITVTNENGVLTPAVTVTNGDGTTATPAKGDVYSLDGTTDGFIIGSFANSYSEPEPIPFEMQLVKKLDGKGAPALENEMFEFNLTTSDEGATVTAGTQRTGADGALLAPFTGEFAKAGTYTFTVSETPRQPSDNQVAAEKYAGISFNAPAKTITVVVNRTADNKLEIASVAPSATVSYADGVINAGTFTNTYEEATGTSVKLTAKKAITGEGAPTPANGQFKFELVNANGEVVDTLWNGEGGNFRRAFELKFDKPGTYTYTVREVAEEQAGHSYQGIQFTAAPKTVEVVVTRNIATNTLEARVNGGADAVTSFDMGAFENTYTKPEPAQVKVKVVKSLTDADGKELPLKAGQFTFGLFFYNNQQVATATNDENGVVDFGVVDTKAEEAVGLGYHVREIAPEGATQVSENLWVKDGISYDTSQKFFTANVKLDAAANAYVATVSPAEIQIENKVATSVSGTKTWNDAANQDGKRPASITVNLLADGAKVDSKTVKAADRWTYTFSNLPKYAADGVTEIAYTVEEEPVAGYEAAIDGFNITNTHTPETTKVEGAKTWNDANNQDGKRPESITVRLHADGTEVASQKVTEANGWAWLFTDLPKYKAGESGKEITYTITEDAVAEYATTVDGFNVTNTYTPGKTSVSVTKAWNDEDDADGLRPAVVTAELLADGQPTGKILVLTEQNNWTGEFTNLDLMANGKKIAYTIKEGPVRNYTVAVTGDATQGFTITNTHEVEHPEPAIGTTATDAADGDHKVAADVKATVTDRVTYQNLVPGREYKMVGELVKKAGYNELNKKVLATAEATFVAAEGGSGSVDLTFTFDARDLAGEEAVAFETCYEGTTVVATHNDINDPAQTVEIIEPEIGTTATDSETNDHIAKADESCTIVDVVAYENLTPGRTYTLTGELVKKSTYNEAAGVKDVVATATSTFVASNTGNGTTTLEFTFDASALKGDSAVAFETVTFDNEVVAVHADITDASQTVDFPEARTTADADSTTPEADKYAAVGTTTIVDIVKYENLIPGKQYTVEGTLHDKETGQPLSVAGATARTKFTPAEPNGEVRLEFTVDTTALVGKAIVAFESVEYKGVEVAVHADINDPDQTVYVPEIGTNATDSENNDHIALADEEVTITDTVDYKGLIPGETYTMVGQLVKKSDGSAIQDATAQKTFVADESGAGVVDLVFTINANTLAGDAAVAFESCYEGDAVETDAKPVAEHKDINDEDQTVIFPEAKTNATDAADGDHTIKPATKVTVIDTVTYSNLIPGKEYTVSGTLHDKETGAACTFDGATATTTFVADKADGSVQLTFTFDASELNGKQMVAFEQVSHNGEVVAVHEDINDASQTVTVEGKTVTASVVKKWENAEESTPIKVTITSDPASTIEGATQTLSEDNGWSYTWTNLPKEDANGTAYSYAIEEEVPEGYERVSATSALDLEGNLAVSYTNKKTPVEEPVEAVVTVDVVKKWTGEPANSIQLNLLRNNEICDTVTVTAQDNWAHTWNNLPKADENDVEYNYTVSEVESDDYFLNQISYGTTVDAEGNVHVEYELQNTETPELPVIATNATDGADGDRKVVAETQATVVDKVAYSGLKAGQTYMMNGTLVKKGEDAPYEQLATATAEFVAEEDGEGFVELTFTFDASKLGGSEAVAFEQLMKDGVEITTHADINDPAQTVEIVEPDARTTATDAADGDKLVDPKATVEVKDVVKYTNLTPGRTYTLTGELVKKSDYSETNKTVVDTKTVTFTPAAANGEVELVFTVDASKLAGESLVAFETVSYEGTEVVVHANINDADQTVDVDNHEVEISKTDAATSEELPGAKLIIENAEGKVVESWTSGTEPHKVKLAPGEYTLTEITAPKGYEVAETIPFTVDGSGLVGPDKVEMKDAPIPEQPENPTVKINKTDIGGTEIDGAVITVTGENFSQTWVSKAGQTMDITVEPGTYTLVEEVAPAGYQKVTTAIEFDVDAKGNVTVANVNVEPAGAVEVVDDVLYLRDAAEPEQPENPTVEISKTDAATSAELPGATLIVKDADGNVVAHWVSTTEPHKIQLAPGEYTLTEITAPKGYEVAETIPFTVDENGLVGSDKVVMEDKATPEEPEPGPEPEIGTTATDEADGDKKVAPSGTAKVVDEVVYKNLSAGNYVMEGQLVKKSDGTVLAESSANFTVATDYEEGTVKLTFTVDASKLGGTSAVAFESAYEADENFQVAADAKPVAEHKDINDPDQTVEFVNPTVEISKTDAATSAELPGAKLIIENAEGKVVESWTSGTEPHKVQLAPGEYTLTEITAPKGYEVAETIPFTVDENGLVGSDKVEMKDAPTPEQPENPTVKINKTDMGGTEIDGAVITVTGENFSQTWVSKAGQTMDITVEPGTYTLVEEVAPAGYQKVTTAIEFDVDAEGNVTVANVDVEPAGAVEVVDGVLYLRDAAEPEQPENPTVEISKTDAATSAELPGATLIVKDADGNVVAHWVSTTEPHKVQLAPGEYTLTELTAPKGYEVAETIPFTVDENGLVGSDKVVMEDKPVEEPKPEVVKVTVVKTWKGEAPANLMVQLMADGAASGEAVELNAGNNWTAEWTDLAKGPEYTVEEAAVEGYTQTKFSQKADNAGNVTIEIENTKEPEQPAPGKVNVTVEKTWDLEEGAEAPATLGVQLMKNGVAEGEPVQLSAPAWTYSWTDLAKTDANDEAITYDVVEVADASYVQTKREFSSTTDDQGNVAVAVSFTNKVVPEEPENPTVEISKTDAATSAELPGATLIVKDADGNVVAHWVSTTEPHKIQLAPGEYTLTELTAPKGYEVAETIPFTVDENGLVGSDKVVMEDKPVEEPKPEPQIAKVTVEKAWSGEDTTPVTMQLTKNGAVEGEAVTLDDSNNWTYTWDNLDAVDANDAAIAYDVVEADSDKYEMVNREFSSTTDAKGNLAVTVRYTNKVVVPEEPKPENPTIKISKVSATDATKELEGAELVIKDASGKIVENWISGSTIHEVQLAPGVYTLIEITAPNGYEVAESITFTVNEEGLVNGEKVTMVDAPSTPPITTVPEVEISKVDAATSAELPGATLTVTDADNNTVATWTSTSESYKIRLKPGVYKLTELTAPFGYQVAETITFTVDENGLVGGEKVVMEDQPETVLEETTKAGTAEVHKAWFNDQNIAEYVAVTFEAQYSFDGVNWIDSGKTVTVTGEAADKNGVWVGTFTGLPVKVNDQPVQWRAVESKTAGYEQAITAIAGPNGMKASNLVENPNEEPVAAVAISKYAADTNQLLPGAKLQLLKDGVVLQEWTSTAAPYRCTLEAGTYVLHEVSAPAGYELAADVTFVVDQASTVDFSVPGAVFDEAKTVNVRMDDQPTDPGTTTTVEEKENTPKTNTNNNTNTNTGSNTSMGSNVSSGGTTSGYTPSSGSSTSGYTPASAVRGQALAAKTGDMVAFSSMLVLAAAAGASALLMGFSLRRARKEGGRR